MKVLIYPISFILLFFVAKLRSEQLGQVDIIDFDTLIAEKHLSEGFVVLVAVNEEKAVDVLIRAELFNKLKPLIEEYQPSVKIFAVTDPKFAKKFSFLKLPQIVFYRNGRFIQYKGEINSKKLIEWIDKTSQRRSIELNDANFEHDTQASTGSTTGDWFVLFAKTDCKTAQFIETSWELASLKLENRVLFAYVDYTQNPKLQERFNLNNSPTLIFFKSGLMYRYDFSTFEVDNLVSFVTAAYKNIKSEKVPTEITLFDQVVDEAVKFLKKQKLEKHLNTIYICGISALVLIFALVVYIKCIRTTSKTKKGKYSFESKEYHKLE